MGVEVKITRPQRSSSFRDGVIKGFGVLGDEYEPGSIVRRARARRTVSDTDGLVAHFIATGRLMRAVMDTAGPNIPEGRKRYFFSMDALRQRLADD